MSTNKLVVVIGAELPIGVALNTAALLGVGLGAKTQDVVGHDTVDGSGETHLGMCASAIPILRAPADQLAELRSRAAARPEVDVHDMHQVARRARTYAEMSTTLSGTKAEDIEYLGLALHGPRAAVDSLTGALPLYR